MNIKIFYLLLVVLFSNFAFSAIPEEFKNHIDKSTLSILKTYNDDQKNLVIESFINYLQNYYKIKLSNQDFLFTKKFLLLKIEDAVSEPILEISDVFRKFLLRTGLTLNNNNMINIDFEGLSIPLTISTTAQGDNLLVLDGIKKDALSTSSLSKLPCLELKIDENKIHINHLLTDFKICPINPQRSGTFLLEFTEHLANILSIPEISLNDASMIRCSTNNQYTSLALLNIFKNGVSWYGSHGYFFEGEKQDKLAAKEFRELSLEKFKEIIKEEIPPSKRKPIETKLSEYKAEQTIGNFFTWLWENNCSLYTTAIDLLFPEDKTQGMNPLLPTYLHPNNNLLTKKLH